MVLPVTIGGQSLERPHAAFDAYRALIEEPVYRPAAAEKPYQPQRFPRLSAGQLARAVFLMAIVFLAFHLPHGGKAQAGGAKGATGAMWATAKS